MSPLKAVLPFVIVNVVLIIVAIALIVTGHHVAGLIVMFVDAANLMVLRWRFFRLTRGRRRRGQP